jgi:hypothetical protein
MDGKIPRSAIVALSVLAGGLVGCLAAVFALSQRHHATVARLQGEVDRLERQWAEASQTAGAAAASALPVARPTPPAAATATPRLAPEGNAESAPLLAVKDNQIEALQGQLAASQAKLAEAEQRIAAARDRGDRGPPGGRARFDARMEELRQTDPARYQAMQEQRARMREQMTNSLAKQSALVMNLDVEQMTEDQRANHDRLVQVLEENWKCMDILNTQPESEQAAVARQTLRDNRFEMRDLLASERQASLMQMARSIGYSENPQEFADAVSQIVDLTSPENYLRRNRPPEGLPPGAPPRGAPPQPALPVAR